MDLTNAFPSRVELGSFELSSSQLAVCDPSYDLDAISHGGGVILENCLPGTWIASVVLAKAFPDGLPICTELRALHPEGGAECGYDWVTYWKAIGVDTGQAGIYDRAHFHDAAVIPANVKWTAHVSRTMSWEEAEQCLPVEQWELMKSYRARFGSMTVTIPTDECGPADPDDLWYSYCCELTGGAQRAGVLLFGVVASSGTGDGGYEFETAANSDGEVIGIRMTFLDGERLANLLGNG